MLKIPSIHFSAEAAIWYLVLAVPVVRIIGCFLEPRSCEDGFSCSQARAQIDNFCIALSSYYKVFGALPSDSEGLDSLVHNPKKPFLDSDTIPLDPWEHPYMYSSEGKGMCQITSYGADGKPGGNGYSADIVKNVALENDD